MQLVPLIQHYLTVAGSAIPDMYRIGHRGPYQIHGPNKNNTLLFPDPSSSSSRFFFTSQEIMRQLCQRRGCMFSYSKQFTFYALSLLFTLQLPNMLMW
jgi:hypothetical protein